MRDAATRLRNAEGSAAVAVAAVVVQLVLAGLVIGTTDGRPAAIVIGAAVWLAGLVMLMAATTIVQKV